MKKRQPQTKERRISAKQVDGLIEIAAWGARWRQYLDDCAVLCHSCAKGRKVYRDGDFWFHRFGRERQANICDAEPLHRAYYQATLNDRDVPESLRLTP